MFVDVWACRTPFAPGPLLGFCLAEKSVEIHICGTAGWPPPLPSPYLPCLSSFFARSNRSTLVCEPGEPPPLAFLFHHLPLMVNFLLCYLVCATAAFHTIRPSQEANIPRMDNYTLVAKQWRRRSRRPQCLHPRPSVKAEGRFSLNLKGLCHFGFIPERLLLYLCPHSTVTLGTLLVSCKRGEEKK